MACLWYLILLFAYHCKQRSAFHPRPSGMQPPNEQVTAMIRLSHHGTCARLLPR